jgi:hypothetical protein
MQAEWTSLHFGIAAIRLNAACGNPEAELSLSRWNEQPRRFAVHGLQGAMSRRNEAAVFIDEGEARVAERAVRQLLSFDTSAATRLRHQQGLVLQAAYAC